jgi:MFS transporter, DHA2 family, multidrug resistance protein
MAPLQQKTETSPPEEGLPTPRRYFALLAVLAALVLVVLDSAIANVALPTMARALHVSPAASVWVVTGYQMALVIALLPCAALGESLGYRRVYMGGVILFTGASVLCALSPSLPWLVVARFIQGLGGAALMALGLALLRYTFPTRYLGSVIGWNALTVALASAIGPSIGAAIISVASWPWLFAVNLPVGAVVLLAGRSLPNPKGSRRAIDLVSVALNAASFGALVLGADWVVARPFLGGSLLAAAALSLVTLIRREMPRKAPLFPLDLLREGSFRISVIASVCCFAAQMTSYIALPFYLQHSLGQSAFMTGLYMTPWPLTVAFAGPISGRLTARISTAWLCAAGGICMALGLTLACVWPLHGNLLPLIVFTVLSGLGFGFFQVPNNRNMLLAAPRERSGAAGGMQGTARQIGQTVGAVIMSMLFAIFSVASAPRAGLAIAAALALAGGLVSTLRVTSGRG